MHDYRLLVNVLMDCAAACEHCSARCLEEKNFSELINCVKLNRECVDICLLTSRLLERDSLMTNDMLTICAKIARCCYEECEKFTQYSFCKECANACRIVEETFIKQVF